MVSTREAVDFLRPGQRKQGTFFFEKTHLSLQVRFGQHTAKSGETSFQSFRIRFLLFLCTVEVFPVSGLGLGFEASGRLTGQYWYGCYG